MLAVIKTHLWIKIFPSVLPGTLRPPCEVWQSRAGWWHRAGEVPPALSDSTRRTGSARAGGWCWSTVHPSGLRSGIEMLYTHYTEIHTSDLLWDYQKTKYIWVGCVCFKNIRWAELQQTHSLATGQQRIEAMLTEKHNSDMKYDNVI